jgi:transposase
MIYPRQSRMPVLIQQKLLEHFVAGTTARAAALLVGVQANTVKLFYQRLRQLIASKQESYLLAGEIEADESYFGGVRKGRRGRGAAGKVPVFGLWKRGGKVYTAIIPDAKASTVIPIIREKGLPDSIVYTDSVQVYDVLDVSEFPHRRVNHSKVFVSQHGHHRNGIENFWIRRSAICGASMASRKAVFIGSWKNVSGASTAVAIKRCYRSSELGSASKSAGLSYSSP